MMGRGGREGEMDDGKEREEERHPLSLFPCPHSLHLFSLPHSTLSLSLFSELRDPKKSDLSPSHVLLEEAEVCIALYIQGHM
jgi:hypothetical protein